jgi:hypothetical protein
MNIRRVTRLIAVPLAACAIAVGPAVSAKDGDAGAVRVGPGVIIGQPVARVAVLDPSLARENEAAIYTRMAHGPTRITLR